MTTARFITLEGGEGVGKTTNMAFIADWLSARHIPFIQTREPGGTDLAEAIRGLLLDTQYTGMPTQTELLLMYAARAAHLQQKIMPALERGEWVLCDRFYDATHAYQGAGRSCNPELLALLDAHVVAECRPDFTLLLDLSPAQGLERASKRSAADRFEQETVTFFSKVRAAYLQRAAAEPQRIKVVDASQPLGDVQTAIAQHLSSLV